MSEPAAAAATNGDRPAGRASRMRLGGMALRNGLLIHGPTSWAAAARAADGSIEVASGPKPSLARGRLATTPLLRGPLRLAEAMAVVPLARMQLRSARLPFEDPAVIGVAAASVIGSNLLRRRGPATVGRELVIAVLGALPALAALRDPALASYHAVEHKAIGGYEQGRDPEEVPKEHERCGSNLIGPMLAFSIAGQLVDRAPGRGPGADDRGRSRRWPASAARSSCSRSPSATRTRRSAGPCTGPVTRSSAWSRPASRPRSSSRSGWPR